MLNDQYFNYVIKAFIETYESSNYFFLKDDIKIWTKPDGSKVTECDKKNDSILTSYLKKTNIQIISEEQEPLPYEERKNFKRIWMIDPLDGTHSFLNKKNDFGILLALLEDRRPILSFVYFPILDDMYFAIKNKGTFFIDNFYKKFKDNTNINLNQLIDTSKKIISKTPTSNEIKILLSKKTDLEEERIFLEKMKKKYEINITRMSACKRFIYLLKGNYHFAIRFHPIHEWDLVSGDLLLEEAGMKVTYIDEKPILYNTEKLNISNVKYFFPKSNLF